MRKINPVCAAILLGPFIFAVVLFVLALVSERATPARPDGSFTSSIR
jgi:hypothetical protein